MIDRYDVVDKKEPRGQSVTLNGIPCTARTCVTILNRLTKENNELKKEIEQIHTYIDNAILTERTSMGKNALKQLKEGLI